ncbi:MAG: hypothetical protein A2836_00865 [Candidatus Taylorbacteria bacterium RIFCSPHIGHO2_01_FULL_45_63]|uniref:Fumarate lyase N-terminal domain-containing protein n=1 Tax=Candidatus Taylorbacteria bacterium RIFCSPHIGHO2_02_FULL_45_35 TaxID=1802311 RepID=A0A1G2MSU1_9BACT|nr:MAG: hypothetical protein A2836_00865 [Candidatus Taylorbacteria bacterium RIFCSPHIGHO2_01_FULL_45_63]OHA26082.1 MAG: hypothetical protein A3D56_02080 [Candidatus Taylorbacteria bacterium RIFCSPHIGHO2_02_FULL_45_35]OHA32486.1 MAG: hypothetical protein A3A22_00130 [Candidatus Taylorbacteria bacterium RIFCSPLOWO2_01_FULL_45_34b]
MKNLALPGNPRYQPKQPQAFFGYDNLFRGVAELEIATLETLGEIGVIPKEEMDLLTPEIKYRLVEAITTTEVDVVEREVTGHDIRAWVRIAQEILPLPLCRWLHLFLTSYDPLDTVRTLQFSRAHQSIVQPQTEQVIRILCGLVRKFAKTVQIGRTHGQHAIPITVGFWLATILSRILWNLEEANRFADRLVGKVSGAVGACNAQMALGITKRCGSVDFEKRVLTKLGLKPARISTQIVPPEPLHYYLFSIVMLTGAFGQLGRDCRHLMRSEIGEIEEPRSKGQVSSSTMGHKRNPVTWEGIVRAYLATKKEFIGGVLETVISDHQRDLEGSGLMRDFPTIVVNLTLQLNALLRVKESVGVSFLEGMVVNEEACKRNLALPGDSILAEPLYIALQMAGYQGDAHKLINEEVMPVFLEQRGASLFQIVRNQLALQGQQSIWNAIPSEVLELFSRGPQAYVGNAEAKALQIADLAEAYLSKAT